MKISVLFRFLFCAFLATGASVGLVAQDSPGRIIAAKVQGAVQKIAVDGTVAPLKNGESLTQKDTVVTGKGASVVLVFENGSTVRIGAESRLEVETFTMDPLDRPIADLSALKQEPSRSQTVLNLSYGEMVGEVKKLNTTGGSAYSVKTPVGAAGIRGTVYRIVFKPSANGKAFFTISTADGVVVMQEVANTADIPVEAGKEVVVEVDTANPGNPLVVTQDIPPAMLAAINVVAQELAEVLKDTETNQQMNEPKNGEEKKDVETKEEAPVLPTEPNPNLTPAAGK
jgi:hypothetical protein